MNKQLLKILFCIATAVTAASCHAAEQTPKPVGETPVLSNLNFANGARGWMLRDSSQLDAVYQADKTPEGNPALSIHLDANSPALLKDSAYIARRDFPVAAGYYQLQFQVRCDLQRGFAGLRISAQKTDQSYLQILNPGQGGAPRISGNATWPKTPWTNYSVVYKIPESVTATIVSFEADNAQGTVSWGNVSLERLSDEEGKALMQQAAPSAKSVQEYGAKMVATPCRIVAVSPTRLIYQPPGLDHSVLVFNSCSSPAGSAIFVDYIKGVSTVVPMPPGENGGWGLIEAAPGKLLFESLEPLSLVTIGTTGGHYKVLSSVPVPGNMYAWQFAKGPDGMIYFGSYPTCHAYRYNPQTLKVDDLGYIGPKGNLYVRYVAVDDRGFLLCSVLFSKTDLVAYNLKTGEQTIVAPGNPGMVQVGGRVYTQLDGQLQEFDAATMKFAPVTSPVPPQGMQWKAISDTSTPQRMVLLASDNKTPVFEWYLCEPGQKPREVWMDGGFIGIDKDGNVLGTRGGQDYFLAAPMSSDLSWRPIAQNPVPVEMMFIRADPMGGVTGGSSYGATLFRYDMARHLEQNTDVVASTGGEVYDGLWVDGKFYFVAYSGGTLGEWDPKQPWDQRDNINPKTLQAYNIEKYGSLIRPIGGIAIGPGKKLYAGWSAEYGMAGGGLTEYDPATGKSRSWTNAIFADAMSIGKITADKKYVYGITSNFFSGIVLPAKPLVFWAFDPATEKVLFQQTLTGVYNALVFQVPETGHVWLADGEGFHLFDPARMQFTQTLAWPHEAGSSPHVAPEWDANSGADTQGNKAWIFAGNMILRLDDGVTPSVKVLFQTNESGGLAANTSDGKLYFTQGAQLWAAPLQ